jgi:hypothetical protein
MKRKNQLKMWGWTRVGDCFPLSFLDNLTENQSNSLTVLYDTQDIEAVRSHVLIPNGTTAVAVESEDGEYIQVWASTSSTPYLDSAIFERIL